MEAHRRLSVLCSHLCPSTLNHPLPPVSISGCVSGAKDDRGRRLPGAGKQNLENGCVFCEIVRGEAPALRLYEDDMCLCILDANPLSHGHSLIIPKSHFPLLEVTPPSVVAAMFSKLPFISKAIMKVTGSDSFNLLVNNGAAAGQVIFHTHIHIIPRKACDCLWTSESLTRHPLKLDKEASRFVDRVQEQLSFLSPSEDGNSQGSNIIGGR